MAASPLRRRTVPGLPLVNYNHHQTTRRRYLQEVTASEPSAWCTSSLFDDWNCDCSQFENGIGNITNCVIGKECNKCNDPKSCLQIAAKAMIETTDRYKFSLCYSYGTEWEMCLDSGMDRGLWEEDCIFMNRGQQLCCNVDDNSFCGASMCGTHLQGFDACHLLDLTCPIIEEPDPITTLPPKTSPPSLPPSKTVPATVQPAFSPPPTQTPTISLKETLIPTATPTTTAMISTKTPSTSPVVLLETPVPSAMPSTTWVGLISTKDPPKPQEEEEENDTKSESQTAGTVAHGFIPTALLGIIVGVLILLQ